MKGVDWAFGCQLVDGALGALGTPAAQMPIRRDSRVTVVYYCANGPAVTTKVTVVAGSDWPGTRGTTVTSSTCRIARL